MQIQSLINIRKNPKADFYFGLGVINILTLGYLFGFLNPGDINTDGGTFAAIAFKDMHGGTLYLDTWDHKPPGIYYLIELFFILIPHKIYALYTIAVLGILGLVNGLFFTVHYLVKSLLICILLLSIFILIGVNSLFMGDGLFTEIFGSLFIIWSLYACHLFQGENNIRHAFTAALLAGFACWFKEPFIFLVAPILIFLLLKIKQSKSKLIMLACAAIPSLFFVLILSFSGSITGFIDMIIYNLKYVNIENKITKAEQLKTLWNIILAPLFILLAIIVVYGIKLSVKKEIRYILVFNVALMSGSLAFILISPDNFNHYYLPFLLIFFYCLSSFLYYEKLYFKGSRLLIYVLLIYSIKKLDDNYSHTFKIFFTPYERDRITKILMEDNSKSLFIDLTDASEYYIKGEKSFPAFLAVPVAYHFNESTQGLKNRKRIYEELKNNKPDFLITGESSSYMYWHIPDPTLYYGNYEKTDSIMAQYGKKVFLWKRR